MDKRFDVIIIGSGAGGGTLARCLAPSGKNILILERGDWLKREAKNWDAVAVFEDNRYISPDTWYDRDGRPFQPQVHYFVGGATKLFGAALYRLRERDFAELHHHDGISLLGRSAIRTSSRITQEPRRCTTFTGCGGAIRPSRPLADPIRALRSPTSRGFRSSATT